MNTVPFSYSEPSKWLGEKPDTVEIKPLTDDLVAERLSLGPSEMAFLSAERRNAQEVDMPHLVGEYTMSGLGTYNTHEDRTLQIKSLTAHAEMLGMSALAYGVYSNENMWRQGTWFGAHSTPYQQQIAKHGRVFAAQPAHWSQNVSRSKDNPFDHLSRGGNMWPVMMALDVASLDAIDRHTMRPAKTVQSDDVYFQPKAGLSLSETVRAIYYPASLKTLLYSAARKAEEARLLSRPL